MADGTNLAVNVIVDTSQLQGGMEATSEAVEHTARRINAAFASTAEAHKALEFSMMEARHAAMLLGEETGVHIPRSLTMVLAHSKIIGPALASAFSGIALIGFIELAVEAAKKLGEFYSKHFTFEAQEKALTEQLTKDNEKLLSLFKEIGAQEKANYLIGLSAADAAKAKLQWNVADQNDIAVAVALEQKRLDTLNEEREALEKQFDLTMATVETLESGVDIKALDLSKQMEENDLAIQTTVSSLNVLRDQLKLVQAKGTGEKKTADKDEANEAATAWKEANQKMIQGFKERAEIQQESGQALAAVMNEQVQAMVEANKRETDSYLASLKEQEKGRQESAKRQIEEQKKIADETFKSAMEGTKLAMEQSAARFENEFKMGEISAQQMLGLKKKALADELAADEAAAQKRLAALSTLDPDYPAQRTKIYAELLALQQKNALQSQKIDEEMAQQKMKEWESIFSGLNRPLDGFIRGTLAGTERVGLAFRKMGAEMVMSTIESLAQIALKEAEHWLIENVLMKSAILQQIADIATGNAAKHAVQAPANIAAVTGEAGVAASAAFASAMLALPFPINIALAPVFGAAALAQGLSYIPVASAAGGMIVPADNILALLHQNEMVLPADVSNKVLEGSGGGDIHVHLHNHFVDGSGVQDFFDRHGDKMARTIHRKLKNMGVGRR
jgi:hypothetical protein